MINYCVISGTVLDGAGNPVPNASLIFNPVVPQVVQGQYIQPIILSSLTGDDGDMIPISLPWGIMVQITVNNAAPFTVMVPAIGAVSFGALAMNAWPVLTFNPSTSYFLEEFPPVSDVSGQIGTNGWSVVSAGGPPFVSPLTAEENHPGIMIIGTDATINSGVSLVVSANPAWQFTYLLSDLVYWQSSLAFRLHTLDDVQMIAGWLNDWGIFPSLTHIGIRLDTFAGDANFHFVCSDGGGANVTIVNTNILADTNWHSLRMVVATAGQILFSLDNLPFQTIVTNVPTAGLTPAFQLTTLADAQKTMDVDFFSFAAPSLVR